MAKNITEIPFTELCERVSEIARERADSRSKVRGVVNDIYAREISRKWDWNFFLVNSAITVSAQLNTGTVSGTTGSSTVTFSSDTVLTQSNNGWKLKISGNDYVYNFTFSQTTGGTVNPPISGPTNPTSTSFNLFQPFYSLAADFDRFPKNGGLAIFQGGTERIIPELPFQEWATYYSPSPTQFASYCRLYGTDTAGNTLLELTPPPQILASYRYDYFKKVYPMRETTAGLIGNVAASGTTVTGDSNTQFTQATTGDYFRIDAFGQASDSEWYRIIAINGNSSITLQAAFGLSGATSASYTICSAPQMPYKLHPGVLYGSILQLCVDQNDPMVQAYNIKFAEVLSDGKRLYVTRNYNQDIHHLGEEWMYRR